MKKPFAILFLLVLMPLEGMACIFQLSTQQALEKSEEIFTGTIKGISCDNGLTKVEYVVNDLWKGDVSQNKVVYGKVCASNKDITFNKNNEYLVYAKLSENKEFFRFFSFSDCGGYTKTIRPNWQEWMEAQWLCFKSGFPIDWSLSKKYGANYDLEQLGKPIHIFN